VKREFFIDNLLVRIHFIVEMILWTGLASFSFPGSFISGTCVKRSAPEALIAGWDAKRRLAPAVRLYVASCRASGQSLGFGV